MVYWINHTFITWQRAVALWTWGGFAIYLWFACDPMYVTYLYLENRPKRYNIMVVFSNLIVERLENWLHVLFHIWFDVIVEYNVYIHLQHFVCLTMYTLYELCKLSEENSNYFIQIEIIGTNSWIKAVVHNLLFILQPRTRHASRECMPRSTQQIYL